ncbi:MAG TPA: NrsF family protein [Alphaproteobacteria bacterium]
MTVTPPSHDDLIDRLAAELKPVRPLASPVTRALGWLAVVAALAVVLAMLSDLDALRRRLETAPDMWLAILGSTLTAACAAFAAFELSVPDRKPAWALLPLPPLLLWVAASGLGCLRGWVIPGTHVASMRETGDCLVFILGLSVPLGAALLLMLRRAFPLRPDLTAMTGALAVAAAAASLLNFFHPFDAAVTDLAVHAIAVAVVIAAGRVLSRRVFAG